MSPRRDNRSGAAFMTWLWRQNAGQSLRGRHERGRGAGSTSGALLSGLLLPSSIQGSRRWETGAAPFFCPITTRHHTPSPHAGASGTHPTPGVLGERRWLHRVHRTRLHKQTIGSMTESAASGPQTIPVPALACPCCIADLARYYPPLSIWAMDARSSQSFAPGFQRQEKQ